MKLIDVCKPIQITSASQCAYIPFTAVPREFAGKTVRVVIVIDAAPAQPADQRIDAILDGLLNRPDNSKWQ